MIFLKVLAVVLGLAFLLFGYFIYFKKKYNLINGFEADFKAGRKKEEYAKKVGMILLPEFTRSDSPYPVRQRKARMVRSASADKRLERLARCSLRLCPHLL